MLLQPIEREFGARFLGRLGHRICPAAAIPRGEVLNDAKTAVRAEVDQESSLLGTVCRRATEINQVQRLGNDDVRVDSNQRTVG